MNERLKEIRKMLNLSQDTFAERIGMKGSSVSLLESGQRNITSQVTKAICREFNVDYIWFTTGEGEMISDEFDDIYESIDRIMVGENDFHKRLFRTLVHLDEYELLALERIMDKFINEQKKDD